MELALRPFYQIKPNTSSPTFFKFLLWLFAVVVKVLLINCILLCEKYENFSEKISITFCWVTNLTDYRVSLKKDRSSAN